VLLLDEPLGALDLRLREEMQTELKTLQHRLGITFVYVTHDQGEALSMADRIAVFREGRIEQLDAPRVLYVRPRTAFVARFVGSANVVEAHVAARLTGEARPFAIRPELIEVLVPAQPVRAGAITCEGRLEDVQYHGAASRWHVRIDAGPVLTAARPESEPAGQMPAAGDRVLLAWSPESAVPLVEGPPIP
jgi:putative spermidine/putrescine transport system ATP-binding protein